ncbi:hypothetical protein [Flavobacterium psychrophilum]|uniref:hypothetical protein n=1 Tax=Flavobacterium psychrophilum TaxID=96345 RepID=UPI000B8E451D|nr:hypothetical protein [Flavobacterium psychrophilum]
MKTEIRRLFIIVFTILLISCNNHNDLEGTYYNIHEEDNNYYIQFKDGYYYNGITQNMMRFKYKLEDNLIIVENNGMQIVFNIIDDKTIKFNGILYKKGVDKIYK